MEHLRSASQVLFQHPSNGSSGGADADDTESDDDNDDGHDMMTTQQTARLILTCVQTWLDY